MTSVATNAATWLRGDGGHATWGLQGGLQVSIPSDHPGTLRISAPCVAGGKYATINYLSIETIVSKKPAASDQEHKAFSAALSPGHLDPGKITDLPGGQQSLDLMLRLPRLSNGAHVRIHLRQRSDRPEEIAFTVEPESDSGTLSKAIVFSNAGHVARTRLLWLKIRSLSASEMWVGFASHTLTPPFQAPLASVPRLKDGSILVATNSNEYKPASVPLKHWNFPGGRVTEYFRMNKGTWSPDLQVALRGRYDYPNTHEEIPGRTVIEEVGLDQTWKPGQTVYFGTTLKSPQDLGVTAPPR